MRVLIIEDEGDLRSIVASTLRETGYAVDEAVNGDEGLFKATSNDYDAIILDLMIPKQDGFMVLANLRKTHKTPVLIMTAREGLNDRVRGLDYGADDYLIKPFELVELQARLRALIRRSLGHAESVIQVKDLLIDTAARVVRRGDQSIPLTAMEYSLVEYLMLYRGELVTRTMIYDHLFDETEDSLSNLIDVHIYNVRKKLGKDIIITRRGQGYMIDGP